MIVALFLCFYSFCLLLVKVVLDIFSSLFFLTSSFLSLPLSTLPSYFRKLHPLIRTRSFLFFSLVIEITSAYFIHYLYRPTCSSLFTSFACVILIEKKTSHLFSFDILLPSLQSTFFNVKE
jgi:hypothetical protein